MRALTLFPTLLALGACTLGLAPPAPSPGTGAPSARAAGPAGTADAQRAVGACREAAVAQGLSVGGVEGTEEVRGAGGLATGQNVFLAVSRPGAAFTLRCSYTYSTAQARIMTL